MDTKTCNKCGETKAISEFYKHKDCKYGVRSKCKVCVKTESAEYYAENRNKKLAWHAKWRAENQEKKRTSDAKWQKDNPGKRRAIKQRYRAKKRNAQGDCTAEQLQARFDYHGNKCVYCDSTENLHADHQIPLSRGGTNFASNMVPACASCNLSKGAKTPEEFLLQQFNIAMDKLINGKI